jgi:hypothetical protein
MSGSRRRCLAVGVAAEVKNKLSVVDVVGETVSLKKAGTTYKGCARSTARRHRRSSSPRA